MSRDTIIVDLDISNDDTIIDVPTPRPPLDLLAHRYTPTTIADIITVHRDQAELLRSWIENRNSHQDDENDSTCSGSRRASCIMLAGPPGVGKTSLVYSVASQLGMHVVEFNASQKRDGNLVKKLKLANQETGFGIIPFTKTSFNVSTASIILIDDADALFEQDTSFWSSMTPFIETSKRPVVTTVTQSIDKVTKIIPGCLVLELRPPGVDDLSTLLNRVCEKESFSNLIENNACRHLASNYGSDIRQCLNRLHFFGDNPKHYINELHDRAKPVPAIHSANLDSEDIVNSNRGLLKVYGALSIIDILESTFNLYDRKTLLKKWIENQPSCRNEESGHADQLAQDIQSGILELTEKVYSKNLMEESLARSTLNSYDEMRSETLKAAQMLDSNIRCRIVDTDFEFYTEIGPYISDIILTEHFRKLNPVVRRARRFLHYLDTIETYFDENQMKLLTRTFGFDHEDKALLELYAAALDNSDKITMNPKKKPKRKRIRLALTDNE